MSPTKASVSDKPVGGGMFALALKVPVPAKTGNYEQDQRADSDRHLLMCISDECAKDTTHILPLYTTLQKRIVNMGNSSNAPLGDQAFASLPVLSKLDGSFMSFWITSVSDFPAVDLARAKQYDTDSITHLFLFGLQLPPGLRMPEQCAVNAVVSSLADHRHQAAGRLLAKLKSEMQFNPRDGVLNWRKAGCYKLTFVEGACTVIAHVASNDTVSPPTGITINTSYNLIHNHSNMDAAVHFPPLPPAKLCVLFKKDSAPTGP